MLETKRAYQGVLFFIKDKIVVRVLGVKYWPNKKMWVKIFNKPKQDNLLNEFSAQLMNMDVNYDDSIER